MLPRLAIQTRQWECFLVFGNFSLFKTPFPGQSSLPTSFVSFFCLLYFFLPVFEDNELLFWVPDCPLPGFRSCFVEFTQRWNVLLMNLWGRKWSPCSIGLGDYKCLQVIEMSLKNRLPAGQNLANVNWVNVNNLKEDKCSLELPYDPSNSTLMYILPKTWKQACKQILTHECPQHHYSTRR